ncbi:hypothetical protein ACLIYM_25475 [Streptomyces fenghuangensis]
MSESTPLSPEREAAETLIKWAFDLATSSGMVDPAEFRATASGLAAQCEQYRAEVERLRAERDAFCDRVDTLTEVAKGNKRHVAELFAQLQTMQRERDEARERYTTGLRRADEQVREMNAELKRYADGDEQPVLWSVYNAMHKRAVTAEARVAEQAKRLTTREREHNADRAELEELRARVAELEQHTTTVRAETLREAARLLEDTDRDDDAVNLLDNMADAAEAGESA